MHYMERLIGLNRDRTLRQSTFECHTQTDGYGQLQLLMIALCPLDHWMNRKNRKKKKFISMIETVTRFITNRSKLCHIDCVSFYQQDCSVCVHGSNVVYNIQYIYCHCHIWIWTNKNEKRRLDSNKKFRWRQTAFELDNWTLARVIQIQCECKFQSDFIHIRCPTCTERLETFFKMECYPSFPRRPPRHPRAINQNPFCCSANMIQLFTDSDFVISLKW